MDCQDGAGAGPSASENRSKVNDLREQILQLTGHAVHEEEEELVSFLMEFVKDHCSGIDGTNSDKKVKKRRRMKEEESLSSCKPSKKKKQEGEEEADGRNGVEDRAKYSDCDLMDNRYICADYKKEKFPNGQINFEPSQRINGCVSENFDGVSLSEEPILTGEQAMITTPSKKLVTTAERDSTKVKASKKESSIIKNKGTPKEDHKVKSFGKQESKGDTKHRKQAVKPSKDELREAVFLILDTADFATMTFGDVVKEVDKYFGKDLFERKPLIRSLIEEELFRLTEEAEKKELEEEEAAEANARAEHAAKEMAHVRTVESGIDKPNVQASQDGKTKDSSKNTNDSTNEKVANGGASMEPAVKRNNSVAAEGSQDHKADADTQNENTHDELTKDGKDANVAPTANGDSAAQGSSNGESETMKNKSVETLERPEDGKVKCASNGEKVDTEGGKVKGASNGENVDTEDSRNEEGRSWNDDGNAEAVNGCEAEECSNQGNDERVEHTEDGKAQEAHNNEKSANVEIYGEKDGKGKEGDINAGPSQADAGGNGNAEDAEHNANTKVYVDSGKNGAAENGKSDAT
ncbi:hypothetical protein BAE44_0004157 [Dichanthelium oligosanthes]|uniref:DEK-C domain-containing protein n=1 Tax=Dichanthelium oligosanthes TaxID=888268 RepID=A0A1E5WBX6_9POAL|nr:hypothetical protein BAE44_0004157 [Dichanthelium oligosanthes]